MNIKGFSLNMCIYIVEISFGMANEQLSSIFDRVICTPHDSGGVLSFGVFILEQKESNAILYCKNDSYVGSTNIWYFFIFLRKWDLILLYYFWVLGQTHLSKLWMQIRCLRMLQDAASDQDLLCLLLGVVGCGKGVGYLTSPGRPTDTGFQLGKACYPCSR